MRNSGYTKGLNSRRKIRSHHPTKNDSVFWLKARLFTDQIWKKIPNEQGVKFRYLYALIILIGPILIFFLLTQTSASQEQLISPQPQMVPCVWEICSIDTMKTSRDQARDHLNDPSFDKEINTEILLIKNTGANYVSLNTPYDEEFIPYLKRWISAARNHGLKVYFRGNWSVWEGWFGYPKNMTPEEHLLKNDLFITSHAELFADGDIFDPCPECENAGYWPQNAKNRDYQLFIQTQQDQAENSFKKINKNVLVYQSVIGGRAKDVLDQTTFDRLHNTIAIDHYVNSPASMSEYIDYFARFNTQTLISEFGSPIPNLNGPQDEKKQAEFINQILQVLYQKRERVVGVNYWVLSVGTTSLINPDGSKRAAYDVLTRYFKPAMVQGKVIDELGKGVRDISIKTKKGDLYTKTDQNGFYRLLIPPDEIILEIDDSRYSGVTISPEHLSNGGIYWYDFQVIPTNPSLLYKLQLWWYKNKYL